MKKIDFTQPGGFGLTQHTLDFMQDAYEELKDALLGFVGGVDGVATVAPPIIFTGVEVQKTPPYSPQHPYVTPGWVIRDEELLRFSGAYLSEVEASDGIGISEVRTAADFHDNSDPEVYVFRRAVAGGSDVRLLSEYVRIQSYRKLPTMLGRSVWLDMASLDHQIAHVEQVTVDGADAGDIALAQIKFVYIQGPSTQVYDPDDVDVRATVIGPGLVKVSIRKRTDGTHLLGGIANVKLNLKIMK